jgi:hypothetical protein
MKRLIMYFSIIIMVCFFAGCGASETPQNSSTILASGSTNNPSSSESFKPIIQINESYLDNQKVPGLSSVFVDQKLASSGVNYALQFDGSDQVVIPHSNSISFSSTSNYTYELWFMQTANPSIYHLLSKRSDCGHSELNYQLARDWNALFHAGSCSSPVSTNYDPPINEWVHVSVTYDGSMLKIYLNGQIKVAAPYTMGCITTAPLRIGAGGTCGQGMIGYIDEVRMWNVTRTAEEIANTYNRTINPNTPGLVGYWNFDEDEADQNVYDSSQLGNNGTLGASLSVGSDDPVRVVSTAPLIALDHDASIDEIIAPADTVVYQTSVVPQVQVRNNGLEPDSIPVTLQIGFDYEETIVVDLLPGASQIVSFPAWNANVVGSFPIQAKTSLPEDQNNNNDLFQTTVAVTTNLTSPLIFKVDPNIGGNAGNLTIYIYGDNFVDGAVARLVKTEESDIIAVTEVESKTVIKADFNLRGSKTGSWDLVVTNPNNEYGEFKNSVSIEEGGKIQIWVDFIGRIVIRTGTETTYLIQYGNTGNINATWIPFFIWGIPKDATVKIEVGPGIEQLSPAFSDPNQDPFIFENGDKKIVGFLVPVIPPIASDYSTMKITVPSNISFELSSGYFNQIDRMSEEGTLGKVNLKAFDSSDQEGLKRAAEIAKSLVGEWNFWLNPSYWGKGFCIEAAAALYSALVAEVANAGSPLSGWGVQLVWSNNCGHQSTHLTSPSGKHYLIDTMINPWVDLCEMEEYESNGVKYFSSWCGGWSGCSWQNLPGDPDLPCRCPEKGDGFPVNTVNSWDPNNKVGAIGFGDIHFKSPKEPLPYVIYFENNETATAPAQVVKITDQIDLDNFDLKSISIGEIAFSNNRIVPPPNLKEYSTDVDLRPDQNLLVRIHAYVDPFTGIASWTFSSIDPDTGLPPEDPMAGFLPPNVSPPEGEGYVVFNIKTKSGLSTGTELSNKAKIIFDANPPIDTPEWLNTLDAGQPESQVKPLAATQIRKVFNVTWSGNDDTNGSGIKNCTVYVSDNDGAYTEWILNTTALTGKFTGEPGHSYRFYSIATDNVGNMETIPTEPDASTTVSKFACFIETASNDSMGSSMWYVLIISGILVLCLLGRKVLKDQQHIN